MGLAAAALYIACLQNTEKETQKDIAEAAGVTEVTVRNRYKDLMKTAAPRNTRSKNLFLVFFAFSVFFMIFNRSSKYVYSSLFR